MKILPASLQSTHIGIYLRKSIHQHKRQVFDFPLILFKSLVICLLALESVYKDGPSLPLRGCWGQGLVLLVDLVSSGLGSALATFEAVAF